MSYFFAAAAASGFFVAAGWRSKRARGIGGSQVWRGLPADPFWGDPAVDVNAPEAQADVGAAIRLVMKRLAPVIASRSVQAEIAAPSGLLVSMRSAALADLLEDLLAAAIHSAPLSRLLMTATPHGDRIDVGITDDMPGADLAVRRGSVRGLMERVALRGGTLDIKVRPSEGTTMTLRLAAATERDRLAPEPITRLSGCAGLFVVRAER